MGLVVENTSSVIIKNTTYENVNRTISLSDLKRFDILIFMQMDLQFALYNSESVKEKSIKCQELARGGHSNYVDSYIKSFVKVSF